MSPSENKVIIIIIIIIIITVFTILKELEHRKLGWKVLILKYDLGKKCVEIWLTLNNFWQVHI